MLKDLLKDFDVDLNSEVDTYIPEGYHVEVPAYERVKPYKRVMNYFKKCFSRPYLKGVLLSVELFPDEKRKEIITSAVLTAMLNSDTRYDREVFQWVYKLEAETKYELMGIKDIEEIEINSTALDIFRANIIKLSFIKSIFGIEEAINRFQQKTGMEFIKTKTIVKKDDIFNVLQVPLSKRFIDFCSYIYCTYRNRSFNLVNFISKKWKVDKAVVKYIIEKFQNKLFEIMEQKKQALAENPLIQEILTKKLTKKEAYHIWKKHKILLRNAGISYEEFIEKTVRRS